MVDKSCIITYGRKNKKYIINLIFTPYEFMHVAGFQYLTDINMPKKSSKKLFDMLHSNIITENQLTKSIHFKTKCEPRLKNIINLPNVLSNNFKLYSFQPQFYNFHTTIRADFIIRPINGESMYFARWDNHSYDNNLYVLCSTFSESGRDYLQNQRQLKILEKNITDNHFITCP